MSSALTAGARYSWDKVTAQPFQYFFVDPAPQDDSEPRRPPASSASKYQFNVATNLIYATGVARLQADRVSASIRQRRSFTVPTSFKKETVNALEIGTKNDFFDRTRSASTRAGYYYWYNVISSSTARRPAMPVRGRHFQHSASAEVYGAEFGVHRCCRWRGCGIDGNAVLSADGKLQERLYLTIDAQTAAQIRRRGRGTAIGCDRATMSAATSHLR